MFFRWSNKRHKQKSQQKLSKITRIPKKPNMLTRIKTRFNSGEKESRYVLYFCETSDRILQNLQKRYTINHFHSFSNNLNVWNNEVFLAGHLLVCTVIVHVKLEAVPHVQEFLSLPRLPLSTHVDGEPCNKAWMCQDFSALTGSQKPFAQ